MASGFKQLGSTGRNEWGPIYPVDNAAVTGRAGARRFREVRLDDPTGMLMYQALALPARTVVWKVQPGGAQGAADQAAADFTWDVLNDIGAGDTGEGLTWIDLLSDVVSFFWAGWSYFEMVLKRRADGHVGFKRVMLLPQDTLNDWKYDPDGDLIGMEQMTADGGVVTVPLARSLLFRTSREGGSPEGLSIYRAALRTYDYKRKLEQVEGIGLRRRWAGFPTVTLPAGASTAAEAGVDADESRAEAMIENIYRDRMMGAVLAPGWELDFGGPPGNVDRTMGDTIKRKDTEMARAVLAQFLMLGLSGAGSWALAKTLYDLFVASVEAYLNTIAAEFNKKLVPYLFKYNTWPGLTGLPLLVHAPAQSIDLAALAQYIDSLTKAGIGLTDAPAVNFLRGVVPGLPEAPAVVVDVAPTAAGGMVVPTPGAGEQDEIDAAVGVRGETFAARQVNTGRLLSLTENNKAVQVGRVARLPGEILAALDGLSPEQITTDLVAGLITGVLVNSMIAFREKSVLDITAAFWLGYGSAAGGGEVLPVLQREIGTFDQWLGFAAAGAIVPINPGGGMSLYGDIDATLRGSVAAVVAALRLGRREEVFGVIERAVGQATQGYSRAGLYAGSVWHAGWAGAVERAKYSDARVRWRLDPLAEHCPTCLEFGGEYPSLQALLTVTGGILPGAGTECDGNCRCGLEAARGGVWGPL